MKRRWKKPYKVLSDPHSRRLYANRALESLRQARDYANGAGSGYLLPKIEDAISSALGAVRNASNRSIR